jgi:CubicO group peptidase (beta-lactamase class C family)
MGSTIVGLGVAFALVGCQAPPRPESGALSGPASPHFNPGGPNADEYGAQQAYPVAAIDRPRFYVGSFSHQDRLWEGRLIRRADTPSRLNRAPAEPPVTYRFEGRDLTLSDYLGRNPTTGLLIARGDTILVERYQYSRHDRHRFMSASMAKSVTAMLIGIAIAEGKIRSVDDTAAAYVPALAGTEYGRTSLRHLLQMSSGVRFQEGYSGVDDFARLWIDTVLQRGSGGAASVQQFNERSRWGGAVFSYASAETQVLGLVLAGAVGRPVAEYLQEKIWKPMGAEAEATWILDAAGQEATFCCLNAVLRDYARLALLLAHDGRIGDKQVIPKAWILEATTVPADRPDLELVWPDTRFGYGYQTWIFPGNRRMFALIGVHGQAIYVDPASRLVLVHTAVRKQVTDPNKETLALWKTIVELLGTGPN